MNLTIDIITEDVEKRVLNSYYNSHFKSKRKYGILSKENSIRYQNEDMVFSSTRTKTLHDNPNHPMIYPLAHTLSYLYNFWVCRGLNNSCCCIHCQICLIKYYAGSLGDSMGQITNNTKVTIENLWASDLGNQISVDIPLYINNENGNEFSMESNRKLVITYLERYNSAVNDPLRQSFRSSRAYIRNILESNESRTYALCLLRRVVFKDNNILTCGYHMNRPIKNHYWEIKECPNTFTCFDSELREECAICISKTCSLISSRPVKLNCGHIFHEGCLTEWVDKSNNKTCPFCRQLNEDVFDELVIRNKYRRQIKEVIVVAKEQLEKIDGHYSVNI